MRKQKYKKPNKIDYVYCPICKKVIHDIELTIMHKETNKPAHFDCIIKEIKRIESINENEKICYLGKGSFGIITFRNYSSNHIRFLIRKRIQYEEKV